MLLPHVNQFYRAMARISYSNTSAQFLADKYIPFRGDYKNRRGIPALSFSQSKNTVLRPKPESYPKILKTIGDHIRAWRLDNNLIQADLAKILEVCEDTIVGWEMRGRKPAMKQIPGIIKLLGHISVK